MHVNLLPLSANLCLHDSDNSLDCLRQRNLVHAQRHFTALDLGHINDFGSQRTSAMIFAFGLICLLLLLIFFRYFRLIRQQLEEVEEARQEAMEATKAKSEFLFRIYSSPLGDSSSYMDSRIVPPSGVYYCGYDSHCDGTS